MLQYYDINCKPVITLLYLLTIQLMVYNRTITRFIADDKVAYQRVRGGDTIRCRQQLSTTSFEACELEITVNYFLCEHLNRVWQFRAQSNQLTDAFLARPPN